MNLQWFTSVVKFAPFLYQVLEYRPEPWDQWVEFGNLEKHALGSAVISIGPQQLHCISSNQVIE